MLGKRSEEPPVLLQPPSFEKTKKRANLRKKINSVKSFFGDRHKRQSKLSRNASLPDIHVAMNGELLGPEYTPRKYSEGNYNKGGVMFRDRSRLNSKLNLRPRSECLQLIDENSSFNPRLPWMNRHPDDFSPSSSLSSVRSERFSHPNLRIIENDETSQTTRLSYLSNLERLSVMESLESLLSNTSVESSLTDENQNEIGKIPRTKSREILLPGLYAKEPNNNYITKNNINNDRTRTTHAQNGTTVHSKTLFEKDNVNADVITNRENKTTELLESQTPDLPNGHRNFLPEAKDTRQRKPQPSLEYHDLKFLMEFEARRVLSDTSYDAKVAAKLSKEISGNIRERLRDHTSRNYKIVVNTFIGSIATTGNSDQVHMASRSVTDPTTDRFITAALQNNDLFVAITLLLLKY